MAEPRTLADIYAQRKALREAQEILDADRPGEGLRSTVKGFGGGLATGMFLGSIPSLAALPSDYKALTERHHKNILKERAKAKNVDPGMVDALYSHLRSDDEAARKKAKELIDESLSRAAAEGKNLKLPSRAVIEHLLSNAKMSAIGAIPLGLLGGIGMYKSHKNRLKERSELLRAAGLEKESHVVTSLAGGFAEELTKIAQSSMSVEPQAGMLAGGVQQDHAATGEDIPVESAPAHGVVASRVNQLTPRRAVGIPVLQPPPGYVYSPELASFVPNEQDPGWVSQEQAIEAARNKGWYDQGQRDVAVQQAQAELDSRAEAGIQQAQMQQAQMQQQAAMQQAAQQQSMMAEAQRQGRINADRKNGIVSQPSGRNPDRRKSKGQGVTIQLGR